MKPMPILMSALVSFAVIGCARPPEAAVPHQAPSERVCEKSDPAVTNAISAMLSKFHSTRDVDAAEDQSTELAGMFDRAPCAFLEAALDREMDDAQIADIIESLSVEFVDRPCESEKELSGRLAKLRSLKSKPRAAAIANLFEQAVDRDARECRRSTGA